MNLFEIWVLQWLRNYVQYFLVGLIVLVLGIIASVVISVFGVLGAVVSVFVWMPFAVFLTLKIAKGMGLKVK